MFVVLYSRYKSVRLSVLIMANIPLALVGAVIYPTGFAAGAASLLSVAALTSWFRHAWLASLGGTASSKVSHFINLHEFDHQDDPRWS